MSIFDLFKPKTKVQPQLTDAELRWNHMWDLWTEGKAASPYAELMTYESEVNNGGHSQFFFNVSNTEDLPKIMEMLCVVLPDILRQNIEKAYQAYLETDDDEEDEEINTILGECDDVFYKNEGEIETILKEYAEKKAI